MSKKKAKGNWYVPVTPDTCKDLETMQSTIAKQQKDIGELCLLMDLVYTEYKETFNISPGLVSEMKALIKRHQRASGNEKLKGKALLEQIEQYNGVY